MSPLVSFPKVLRVVALLAVLPGAALAAAADVCVSIDETRDTLSPQEQRAAVLLLARQFEREGERVVDPGCSNQYVVAHVRLGNTITVTLRGPQGARDAAAANLDDIAAVYSQMVRSLLRNVPMNAPGVIDRTNVSDQQSKPANRVRSDSLTYAKLGFGTVFADRGYGGPAMTLIGYRRELDRFAVDISFINVQRTPSNRTYSAYAYTPSGTSGSMSSWLKFLFLRFNQPTSARSAYVGSGVSWTMVNLDHDAVSWEGNGLQGEIVGGYEIGRASTVRVFLETDVGLPFYNLTGTSVTFSNSPPYSYSTSTSHRWAPSAMVSLGVGWQRGGR